MKVVYLLGVILSVFAMSGCSGNQVTSSPPVATITDESLPAATGANITLTTEDNIDLNAYVYFTDADLAVVYAHMGIADQSSWQAFAAETAAQGITALTFDFRCFGLSECSQGIATELHLVDVLAAIRYLQDQGYQRIVCMGASMGATACLHASMQEELAGLVFIAGDREILLNGKWYPDDIVNPAMSKLFIVAEQDPYSVVVSDTRRYYNDSPEPRQLIIYPEAVHGTDLFDTPSGEQFHQALMDFLLAIK